MMPLKYSNFLVAARAVLPFYPLYFCYYFTTVQHNEFALKLNFQGSGEVH